MLLRTRSFEETVMTQAAWWREPTKPQWTTFIAAWLGWILDAFDFTVFLLVMPEIAKEFGVTHTLHGRGHHASRCSCDWHRWRIARAARPISMGPQAPLMLSLAVVRGDVMARWPSRRTSSPGCWCSARLFGFGMGAEWTAGTTLGHGELAGPQPRHRLRYPARAAGPSAT
jgi:SHS family lactate transporter-like MFS transporter